MLATLAAVSGAGASNRCLPTGNPTPTMIASRISMVKTALPAMTSGCRALFDHLVGIGTRSGSSAARGLRGVIRRESPPIRPEGSAENEELADLRAANGSEIWSVLSAMHPTRCDLGQSLQHSITLTAASLWRFIG